MNRWRQVSVLGAGSGCPDDLTVRAQRALDLADGIWAAPRWRSLIGDRESWAAKTVWAERAPNPDRDWADGQRWVWVVPDTPALSGVALKPVLDQLAAQGQWVVHWISAVPAWLGALDQAHAMLAPERIVLEPGLTVNRAGADFVISSQDLARVTSVTLRGPLYGRRIAVFRDSPKGRQAMYTLAELGAEVVLAPTSEIVDPPNWDAVDQLIHHIERYDWVVFTSAEAVVRWFGRMRALGVDLRRCRARVAAVGPETAKKLWEYLVVADVVPEGDYSQEGLVESFSQRPMRGSRVALPGGDKNREELARALRGRGATVDVAVAYVNRPVPLPYEVQEDLSQGRMDALLFTASSQVEYLVEAWGDHDRAALKAVPAFSIGPMTSQTLQHYGFRVAGEPPRPSLKGLVEVVVQYFA
jgi:uroporphyrinogen-III synthase